MSPQPTSPLHILSGRIIRADKVPYLLEQVSELPYVPILAIIQIGNRADSTTYIKAKKIFAEQIGVKIKHIHFPENVLVAEIVSSIRECNVDKDIQGIIIQLPLPTELQSSRERIIATIDTHKDVDGLTIVNQELLQRNDSSAIIPATARGVKELLDYYQIDLKGKKVVVVGRSALVGTPIARVCTNAGAEVTVCHSKTENLAEETKKADVLIVAIGKPNLIGKEHVKVGQVIIDVGINRALNSLDPAEYDDTNKPASTLQGDVNYDAVKDIVKSITPVPGGVGQMTVVALFENLVEACNK